MSSPVRVDPGRPMAKELFSYPHYTLRCLATGDTFSDEIDIATGNLPLANSEAPEPSFLRAEYREPRLELFGENLGLFRYGTWLPVRRFVDGSSAPVTYRSEALAAALGLRELYITFSGYWPERGVTMASGTFKECEAYAVAGRMGADFPGTLVIASAGNTARAFYRVFSEQGIPVVIVVPEANLGNLWATAPEADGNVTVVAVGDGADYSDAIAVAGRICEIPGYVPEGGAKNVARRDGMGTTMLSAATTLGRIPDHYFQAVGSGTGAIAAWEANLRLLKDGRFGDHLARLHLAQNAPFTLLRDSWNRGSRRLAELDEGEAKRRIARIEAKVLANRKPPYSLRGGLYEALMESGGIMYAPGNREAAEAARLFQETEGVDLEPAAAVAVASLLQAVREGTVAANETIMLNATGGGILRYRRENETAPVKPALLVSGDRSREELAKLLAGVRQQ